MKYQILTMGPHKNTMERRSPEPFSISLTVLFCQRMGWFRKTVVASGDWWWGAVGAIITAFWCYIPCRLTFISVSTCPLTDTRVRLSFTILILEECWLAVRRLAVLLLSDISLHLHSGSQEAESQGNHSTGCVIRMTNQSIFLAICDTRSHSC